jgi:hypothetical protein
MQPIFQTAKLLAFICIMAINQSAKSADLSSSNIVDEPAIQNRQVNLKLDLMREYEKLKSQHALAAVNSDGTDVSPIASKYLTTGMRFAAAATLLEKSGFHVAPLPPRALTGNEISDKARFVLLAQMPLESTPALSAKVILAIEPATEEKNREMTVGKISCVIHLSSP